MALIFKDDFHDTFGTGPIGYIPYGGTHFGGILAVAPAVDCLDKVLAVDAV
jgi:hypothetical protein